MCPESRSTGRTERSRFTSAPGSASPRFERRNVSGITSKESESSPIVRTVRSTPLTAIESPSAVPPRLGSSRTKRQPITSSPPSRERTSPTSSMIPVNTRPAPVPSLQAYPSGGQTGRPLISVSSPRRVTATSRSRGACAIRSTPRPATAAGASAAPITIGAMIA